MLSNRFGRVFEKYMSKVRAGSDDFKYADVFCEAVAKQHEIFVQQSQLYTVQLGTCGGVEAVALTATVNTAPGVFVNVKLKFLDGLPDFENMCSCGYPRVYECICDHVIAVLNHRRVDATVSCG